MSHNCLSMLGGLAKVVIFSTNVDAENQTLINHKCVCEARNPRYRKPHFSGSKTFRPKSCRCKYAHI